MQLPSSVRFAVAAIATSLALMAGAEPIPATGLRTREYPSRCCVPGCTECSIRDCDEQLCNAYLLYNTCCAEGYREMGEDGKIQVFNQDGQKMEFVS
ncbi:hypothetical protein F5Y13DRAFT_190269 [Hypoxylon sp. FL1857]|nr:hypothetical protein F5Y13DRAFT_190269 [Hypoxylon sp. FL1857]